MNPIFICIIYFKNILVVCFSEWTIISFQSNKIKLVTENIHTRKRTFSRIKRSSKGARSCVLICVTWKYKKTIRLWWWCVVKLFFLPSLNFILFSFPFQFLDHARVIIYWHNLGTLSLIICLTLNFRVIKKKVCTWCRQCIIFFWFLMRERMIKIKSRKKRTKIRLPCNKNKIMGSWMHG